MATFSPISTSLAQEMNWTENGKQLQKTDLKAHPVASTKRKNTSLVVE